MKKLVLFVTVLVALLNGNLLAQDVFDPNDPLVTYDPAHPPTVPPDGVIGKWVRTPNANIVGWDISKFKPYIFSNMAFRLRYPNNFNKSDQTKKYPLILFLHGGGEIGPITDNEFHLLLGARPFQSRMDLGEFNAYMLFPQQQRIGWEPYFDRINNIIDSLIKYGNVDPDRVIVMGLSIGGNASILYSSLYPQRTASVIASSPSFITLFNSSIDNFVHIPLWVASGGKDPNPDPSSVNSFVNAVRNKGGSIRYSFFPERDHDSWTDQWAQPFLPPTWNSAHKANPLVFFNRKEFCPDSAISVKIGISPGFYAYEWQKDNVTIASSTGGTNTITDGSSIVSFTGNEITVRSFGTYRTRFKRTAAADWSVWSPQPAVITQKSVTITPAIKVTGVKSRVLPALDGSTTVPLELPEGYIAYEWRRVSDSAIVSTSRTYVAAPGQYIAKVKEEFGCSSQFSVMFTVAEATGSPKPDAAKNLTAYALSQTSIQLDWSDNANPISNETGFEIYRSTTPGGPYKLIAITGADVKTYLDDNLVPQTDYYYKIRAVNETGASALTANATAKTVNDITAPTAPANLKTVFTFRDYIDLSWNSSKDNVGVYKYDVYIDGVKRYTTTDTTFRVNNLEAQKTFNFSVKARDAAGNVSNPSNQVTASSISGGLRYKYYEGIWQNLPDFSTLTPVSTGTTANIDILTPRSPGVENYYGLVWEGYIRLPVAGTYTFETVSDDGSKVYIKSFYDPAATPVVSNDGVHAPVIKSGTVTVDSAGYYPIAITFFENINGEKMELYYTGPAGSGIARQLVPNSAFNDSYTVPGTIPAAPGPLSVAGTAYNKLTLSWTDNSSNETGFEVSRANSLAGVYQSIGTVTAPSFVDSNLNAGTTYYYRVRAIGTAGESATVQGQGTTPAAPAAPNAPGTLAAAVGAGNRINLSWNDLSTGETGFEIYRSTNTAASYRLLTTVPANTTTFADTPLFPNTTYFYKIKAVAVGNASVFSNEASARTPNTKPAIKDVEDFTMKYGTSLTIPVTVTDVDNDDLKITTSRLPRFATLVNISNGNAVLQLNPQDVHRGNYPVKVFVDDLNGGYDTMSFTMIVNSNAVPTLQDISDVSVNEGESGSVSMTATDEETLSAINWTFEGLPSFASFSKDNAGHGNIQFSPGFAASGIYTIKVKADDGNGAWASKSFNLTVNEKPAGKLWLINMKDTTTSPKSPVYWNDLQKISNIANTANLKTSAGVATTVGVNIPAAWNISVYQFGVRTDTGVYPRPVIRDAAYFGVDTIEVNVTNLNPGGLYNFRFFSSSEFNHTGYTGFRFGAKKDSVAMMNNSRRRATLNALAPNASGVITIKVYRTAGTPIGFLNAFEFQEVYNDGSVPVTPSNITGNYVPGSGNMVNWKDIAYNETRYAIFRSTSESGPFTELNPAATNADDSSYTDATAVPGTTYYYFVKGVNTIGTSGESDTITVVTGNNAPVITALPDLYLKTGTSLNTDFVVTDDPGETVTVTAENLPAFATLQHPGGNNYRIVSSPTGDNPGFFYVTIKATDDKGVSAVRKFKITVSDNEVTRTVLLNLTGPVGPVSAPWNNLEGESWAGRVTPNLKTDDNLPTTFSFTSVDYITQYGRGFITGNNSGIVPDSVLAGGLGSFGTAAVRFKIGGLDPSKTYSVGLISSLNSGEKNNSTFTATDNLATQTLSVNSRYNNSTDARFNGLVPTAAGEINFSMASETAPVGAVPWVLLNGIIIQEYVGILRPINLVAEPANTLSRRKIRVTWSDRTNTETGFEVQRSQTPDFATSTTVSLPANTTVHVDSSAAADTKYYYRVRAITGGGNSGYSNVASAISAKSIVYVNLTNSSVAPAPWNNTSKLPVVGDVFTNLKNEYNQNSGLSITIDSTFTNAVASGYNTAANPGILPSTVIIPNYTVDKTRSAKLRIGGLDATKTYRLGFSGSVATDGLYNTAYNIGGRTVYLNAAFNSNKLVYINDVTPNMNGEIVINISTASTTGYLNALIIETYTGANGPVLQSPLNKVQAGRAISETAITSSSETEAISRIYPNPFNENLNIDFTLKANNSKINVEIYDLMGRIVYSRSFTQFMAGRNTLRLSAISSNMSPGVYMLRFNIDGKQSSLIKLVKTTK